MPASVRDNYPQPAPANRPRANANLVCVVNIVNNQKGNNVQKVVTAQNNRQKVITVQKVVVVPHFVTVVKVVYVPRYITHVVYVHDPAPTETPNPAYPTDTPTPYPAYTPTPIPYVYP